jgi:hypothetical protein
MFKGVEVVRVGTMADGAIRLTIDLQDGTAEDIANAYRLRFVETSMLIAPTEEFIDEMSTLVQSMVR